jgi:hypothetical protein
MKLRRHSEHEMGAPKRAVFLVALAGADAFLSLVQAIERRRRRRARSQV